MNIEQSSNTYKLNELGSDAAEKALVTPEDLLPAAGGSPAVFCPDSPLRKKFEAWVRGYAPIAEFEKNASGEYIVLGMQDNYLAFSAGAAISKMERVVSPLPDDVAKMVENLRSRHRLMYKASPIPSVMIEAADLIERLARQVPEGCAVVQRKVTEDGRYVLATPGNYRTYQAQWNALIAAGEVKP